MERMTAPLATEKMPPGVPYIIGNEAAERFSFYGMRTILIIFMTKWLLDREGNLAPMSEEEAKGWFHLFVAGVYFLPMAGAILADAFFGKYRTILCLSIVYCLGSFSLAADQTRVGLAIGLILIAVGSGGIKSCVSANVGDQFGPKNKHLLEKVFGWFYFSINFGSFFSTLLTPWLLDYFGDPQRFGENAKHLGPMIAFGVPGVLMVTATVVFWAGRNKFVHIPPGGSQLVRDLVSRDGLSVLAKLAGLYLFISVFWALYDQTGAAWVLQAEKMDRRLLPGIFNYEVKAAQVQAINPLLVMIMIPLFTMVLYPMANRFVRLTPLRKIGTGMLLCAVAFAISAHAEKLIEARAAAGEAPPSVWWQWLAFVIITMAEVMVSITSLEFSYTQAPNRMKSLVMGVYLLSITLGNFFASQVNFYIRNEDGTSKLPGPSYYWFFTGAMVIATVLYVAYSCFYRERTYIQGEE